MSEICLQSGGADQIVNFNPELTVGSMGGGSSGEESERNDAASQSGDSSRASECPPPSSEAPQLVITQQPRPAVPVPVGCGFRAPTEKGTAGHEGVKKADAPKHATPTAARPNASGKVAELTFDKRRWVEETEAMILEVRSAEEGEPKWIELEKLEDHVLRMAKIYQVEGDGCTSDRRKRLISHLSRWSMRDPLQGVLIAVARVISRRQESLRAAEQGSGVNNGGSLLPTPLLVPVPIMVRRTGMDHPDAPCEARNTPRAPPEKKTPTHNGNGCLERGADSGHRPGTVMRTSMYTPGRGSRDEDDDGCSKQDALVVSTGCQTRWTVRPRNG